MGLESTMGVAMTLAVVALVSFSPAASARDLQTPLPPVDVAATTGEAGVVVSWTAPVYEGGDPVESYHVYRMTDFTTPLWEEVGTTEASTLSFVDPEGVVDSVYAVTAGNDHGQSPQSAPASTQQERCSAVGLSGTPPQLVINEDCLPGPIGPGLTDYLFELSILRRP